MVAPTLHSMRLFSSIRTTSALKHLVPNPEWSLKPLQRRRRYTSVVSGVGAPKGRAFPKCQALIFQASQHYRSELVFTPWMTEYAQGIQRQFYDEKIALLPTTGLWWSTSSNMSVSPKACVRRRARLRLRRMFEKVLREHGLDADGNTNADEINSSKLCSPITGSLRLCAMPPILQYTKEQLHQEVTRVFEHIIFKLRNSSEHKYLEKGGKLSKT